MNMISKVNYVWKWDSSALAFGLAYFALLALFVSGPYYCTSSNYAENNLITSIFPRAYMCTLINGESNQ